MFMHDENVSVRYAAFDDLGRSNKNDPLDDFKRKGYDGLNADRLKRHKLVPHPHRAGHQTAADATPSIYTARVPPPRTAKRSSRARS